MCGRGRGWPWIISPMPSIERPAITPGELLGVLAAGQGAEVPCRDLLSDVTHFTLQHDLFLGGPAQAAARQTLD
jgi:hypothetical protein